MKFKLKYSVRKFLDILLESSKAWGITDCDFIIGEFQKYNVINFNFWSMFDFHAYCILILQLAFYVKFGKLTLTFQILTKKSKWRVNVK